MNSDFSIVDMNSDFVITLIKLIRLCGANDGDADGDTDGLALMLWLGLIDTDADTDIDGLALML